MKTTQADEFFFIDGNRAYRGPVTKVTLQNLLHTQAITTATYVFSESLAECNNSWVRLKRLPLLLEELQRPMGGGVVGTAPSPAGAAAAPTAPASAPSPAASTLTEGPAEGASAVRPVVAAPAPAPSAADVVPVMRTNPTAAPTTAPAATAASSTAQGAGGAAAAPLPPATQAVRPSNAAPPTRELLFGYFPAQGAASTTPRNSSASTGGRFGGFFGSRSKGAAAAKSAFGQPLAQCTLGEGGVPEVLVKLRAKLFAQNGHLVEGIFRVSPSSSVFAVAKKDAESNHLDKISDPESLAQLIKLWFRTRPAPPVAL